MVIRMNTHIPAHLAERDLRAPSIRIYHVRIHHSDGKSHSQVSESSRDQWSIQQAHSASSRYSAACVWSAFYLLFLGLYVFGRIQY